jgi:hypothetical protein
MLDKRISSSYCSCIYSYLCNRCLSPLTLWVRIPPRRGVLDATLCNKVCQWLATGRWFSPDTPVFSTDKPHHFPIYFIETTYMVYRFCICLRFFYWILVFFIFYFVRSLYFLHFVCKSQFWIRCKISKIIMILFLTLKVI